MKENQPRRVCIFCECWESGGIESFLLSALSDMNLEGMEIDIVVSQLKGGIFLEKAAKLGINFRELSGSQRKLFKNYRSFGKILRERGYDVIHLNIFHALSFVYGAIAKGFGVKKRIVHSHNTDLRKTAAKKVKIAVHNISKHIFYRCFTDYWACSSAAARFMFPKKITDNDRYSFIPNGIDIERFTFDKEKRFAFREKLKIGDKPLIVNIGRLTEQKNQSFLLDAVNVLAKRDMEFVLLLAGEGDKGKLDELKKKAENLGMADKVVFYGATSDIPSVLSAADVLAFPSLFEGLGIVTIEAQAAALPVVCSENIPDEAFVTDYIVSVGLNAQEWANALEGAFRADRTSDTASLIKSKGYDIKSVAGRIENSYRGLEQNERGSFDFRDRSDI